MHPLVCHLRDRHIDLELHRPIVDTKTWTVSFLMWNLTGQLVGYQQYHPWMTKSRSNDDNGRYKSVAGYNQPHPVWGMETLCNSSTIFITEGIFDAARLTEKGVAALAMMGRIVPPHIRLMLSSLSRPVVIVCDNDGPGIELASIRGEIIIPPFDDLASASDAYVTHLIEKFC